MPVLRLGGEGKEVPGLGALPTVAGNFTQLSLAPAHRDPWRSAA